MPYKGFILVRDKDGKPKFDDINNIAPQYWDVLTEVEREKIIEERNNGRNP